MDPRDMKIYLKRKKDFDEGRNFVDARTSVEKLMAKHNIQQAMYIATYHKSVEKLLDKHPDLLSAFVRALDILEQNPFP